jgi:hypothetical protein
MSALFETLAFALVIGGQFSAAIVVISKGASLYPDALRPTIEGRSNELPSRTLQQRPPGGWLEAAE